MMQLTSNGPRPQTHRRKVLVVDDDIRNIFALSSVLENYEMEVLSSTNGKQAIEIIQKNPDLAVVLMDIAMPRLNGLEATRQVIKAVPATKVLILSAHSHAAFVKQVTALGAAGFLLKHTSSAVVATAIREVHKGNTFFSPSISKRLNATVAIRSR